MKTFLKMVAFVSVAGAAIFGIKALFDYRAEM